MHTNKPTNPIVSRLVDRFIGDCTEFDWSTPPRQTRYEISLDLQNHQDTFHALMHTYSIHCENCGDILEHGTPGTIATYAVTHHTECPGDTHE